MPLFRRVQLKRTQSVGAREEASALAAGEGVDLRTRLKRATTNPDVSQQFPDSDNVPEFAKIKLRKSVQIASADGLQQPGGGRVGPAGQEEKAPGSGAEPSPLPLPLPLPAAPEPQATAQVEAPQPATATESPRAGEPAEEAPAKEAPAQGKQEDTKGDDDGSGSETEGVEKSSRARERKTGCCTLQ